MKVILSLCILTGLYLPGYAQIERMGQLGGKQFFYKDMQEVRGMAFVYSYRVRLLATKKYSLSAVTHLGLGLSGTPSKRKPFHMLLADIPVVIEFNKGFGATKKDTTGFGYYLGAGYAFQRVGLSYRYGGSSWFNGPVITGGIRFNFPGVAPLDLGVSYMPDAHGKIFNKSIFGISLSYMFGLHTRE